MAVPTVFRYPGGKSKTRIQRWICAHKPSGVEEYREPFVGGGGVFPWHDDFVCEMWIKYRKNNDPAKNQLKELLGIPETNQPQENLLC